MPYINVGQENSGNVALYGTSACPPEKRILPQTAPGKRTTELVKGSCQSFKANRTAERVLNGTRHRIPSKRIEQ